MAPDLEDDHVPDSPLEPSTPPGALLPPPEPSQVTLPSTEAPPSPLEHGSSLKTEIIDERSQRARVVPSSMTPPPSSQVPARHHEIKRMYSQSQQSNLVSPPTTTPSHFRNREDAGDYVLPTSHQITDASSKELRDMLQASLTEHQKLKTETAHYKLQYSLLSLQADEEAKRSAVELEITRKEVEALRDAERVRKLKREPSVAPDAENIRIKQLEDLHEEALENNDRLRRKFDLAKKVISQQQDRVEMLQEEQQTLLNRIRENRETFRMLTSPGGLFHEALTPKQLAPATPQQQNRYTPRQDFRTLPREGSEGMAALLQATSQASQDYSAPSTPMHRHKPGPRQLGKHGHRHAQSLSSLPTTPLDRARGYHASLLPSADLVPQTEPPLVRYGRQYPPETPTPRQHRRAASRESTVSVDDNEELARKAFQSFASRVSQPNQAMGSHIRESREHTGGDGEEEPLYESQASQAATELLRRSARQSFDAHRSTEPEYTSSSRSAMSVADQDTGAHAKMLSSIAVEKRKFSGEHGETAGDADGLGGRGSPTKKARKPLPDPHHVGLGIRYR